MCTAGFYFKVNEHNNLTKYSHIYLKQAPTRFILVLFKNIAALAALDLMEGYCIALKHKSFEAPIPAIAKLAVDLNL